MELERQTRALEDTVGALELTWRRVLRVEGDDARSWLNGVVTQDLREPHGQTLRHALFVDVRGRVLADASVIEHASGAFDLLIPAEVASALLESLDQRIVMEDVELSLSELAVFTAQGPVAASMASASRGIAHDRLGRGGFDLLCPRSEASAWAETLAREAEALGGASISADAYERARIRALRPRFGVDYGPDCYPQEAGLEGSAVSFEKGCYVGQEAVHMLQVRGRPPRRLVGLTIEGALPAPGAEVMDSDGKRVGTLTSVTSDGEGHALALAMLKRAAAEADDALRVDAREARRIALVGAN